jgi:hypothetical protein
MREGGDFKKRESQAMKSIIELIVIFLSAFTFLTMGSLGNPLAAAEEEIIAGIVVQTDEGIIIEAEDGDYLVQGKDLSDMIDYAVEVTGIVTETEEGYVIEVKKVEELQE